MSRPLTPALIALAVMALAACSDNPLAPKLPAYDAPGTPTTGTPPAGSPESGPIVTAGSPDAPPADSSSIDLPGAPADSPKDSSSAPLGGDVPPPPVAGDTTAAADGDRPESGGGLGGTPSDDASAGQGSGSDASSSDASTDSGSAGSSTGGSNGGSNSIAPSSSNGGGNGVSTPITLIGGAQVEVAGGEIVGYRSAPVPAAAGGICGDGANGYAQGTWVKTTNGGTNVHLNHSHCVIRSEAATITISFDLAGTYVVTPSGNLNLNLAPLCSAGVCTDRNVHYRANQNVTAGQGLLLGHGSDGSVWVLDLSQIQHAGHTRPAVPDGINPLHRSYTALTATRQGGSATAQVTLSW